MKILSDLPFDAVTLDDLAVRLKLDEVLREEFEDIFSEAIAIARPKLIYGRAPVAPIDEKSVMVGDMRFVSTVLAVNMKGVAEAFPYVATGGRELHDLAQSKDDPLERYWVDTIAERVMYAGLDYGLGQIRDAEGTGTLYAMNPGSLPDWPISQQRPLFALLGGVMDRIGVELTDSFLMLPVKSVSGLLFESDVHYTNCALCPRDGCPNRREPFNHPLAESKYQLEA